MQAAMLNEISHKILAPPFCKKIKNIFVQLLVGVVVVVFSFGSLRREPNNLALALK